MPLPLKRRWAWTALAVIAIAVLREWNIRRHEAGIGVWPRAGRATDASTERAAS